MPKGFDLDSIDLERALQLLSLPREVGTHPETGKPITAGIGRYGPFVLHDGTYANLDNAEEVFTVGLNRAVSLIAEKQQRGGRRAGPQTLKALGEHEGFSGPIELREGRYGPYVTDGKINATLPRGTDTEAVNLDMAVELLAAKAASGGKGKGRAKGKARSAKGAGKAKS